ncbi:MAG: single-stranded DNA-binding protein [Polyangiaceae bacterium]|nr:single-stranded DNA-binding protein [Polyangiaceae bacterium]
MSLVEISRRLAARVDRLSFGAPVTHVYDPLVYARTPHEAYLERYGGCRNGTLLLGMNPGPFGMAQTGVPFGDVASVRDFLGIEQPVGRPSREHPARPIEGFDCRRAEVSGARLWGWVRERFGAPAMFFSRCFVANYCPLVFIEPPAKNRTPDRLPRDERDALFTICDDALRELVREIAPRTVVGVGAFAEARARGALANLDVRVTAILHPSPASPLANRGWARAIERQLKEAGIDL